MAPEVGKGTAIRGTTGSVQSVAVVGGGVSGLAAAYKLKSNGLRVTIFEAEGRAGGKIRSGSQEGFIWDEGANTMTESEEEVRLLLDDIGLREKQQYPISQNKRYIARNGVPELIPLNPISLINSSFLSTKTKFQILLEPLLWRNSGGKNKSSKVSGEHFEESVGQFFQRHFGKEVVDYLIDPFVAGTSGGDPESLSMRHAFPEIWNLQERFGSVIVGAIRSKLSGKRKGNKTNEMSGKRSHHRGSFSFHGGMQIYVPGTSISAQLLREIKQYSKGSKRIYNVVWSTAHEERTRCAIIGIWLTPQEAKKGITSV